MGASMRKTVLNQYNDAVSNRDYYKEVFKSEVQTSTFEFVERFVSERGDYFDAKDAKGIFSRTIRTQDELWNEHEREWLLRTYLSLQIRVSTLKSNLEKY